MFVKLAKVMFVISAKNILQLYQIPVIARLPTGVAKLAKTAVGKSAKCILLFSLNRIAEIAFAVRSRVSIGIMYAYFISPFPQVVVAQR